MRVLERGRRTCRRGRSRADLPVVHLDRGTHTLAIDDHSGVPGTTIVLLHGGGDSSSTWSPLLEDLNRRGRVLAYDHVGHGRSTIPERYRRRMLDDDLDAVIGWAGDPRPILLGHSLGATIALVAAHRRVPKPRGLVLLDGAPADRHFSGLPVRDAVEERARLEAMGYVEPQLSFFVDMGTIDHDEMLEHMRPELWFDVPVPTITLAATRGPSAQVRDRIDAGVRADGAVELRWVDTGHGVHEDRPDLVLEALDDLLART